MRMGPGVMGGQGEGRNRTEKRERGASGELCDCGSLPTQRPLLPFKNPEAQTTCSEQPVQQGG